MCVVILIVVCKVTQLIGNATWNMSQGSRSVGGRLLGGAVQVPQAILVTHSLGFTPEWARNPTDPMHGLKEGSPAYPGETWGLLTLC